LAGRITSICDVFDALISERPYKPAWPIEKALEEVKSKSGSYFDPRLVVLFMKLETDLRRIVQTIWLL
jgi:putative two-component system response regulator